MDFLYFGEANIFQDNLDSFLALAEELQLKGVRTTDSEAGGVDKEEKTKIPSKNQYESFKRERSQTIKNPTFNPDDKTFAVSVFIEHHPYDPDGFRSTEGILVITNSLFQKLDLLWINPRIIHLVAFTVCFKPSSESK